MSKKLVVHTPSLGALCVVVWLCAGCGGTPATDPPSGPSGTSAATASSQTAPAPAATVPAATPTTKVTITNPSTPQEAERAIDKVTTQGVLEQSRKLAEAAGVGEFVCPFDEAEVSAAVGEPMRKVTQNTLECTFHDEVAAGVVGNLDSKSSEEIARALDNILRVGVIRDVGANPQQILTLLKGLDDCHVDVPDNTTAPGQQVCETSGGKASIMEVSLTADGEASISVYAASGPDRGLSADTLESYLRKLVG